MGLEMLKNDKMNMLQRILGTICNYCLLCRYARNNSQTLFGKFMQWHGKYCPFWKAQKALEREKLKG